MSLGLFMCRTPLDNKNKNTILKFKYSSFVDCEHKYSYCILYDDNKILDE